MSRPRPPKEKIVTADQMVAIRERLREQGRTVVFTNGCFDLLHGGHLLTLNEAREAGDALIVALNSDISVRGLKGETRPIIPQEERCEVMASFACVDYVITFDEPDPCNLLSRILPDVLVKGGDWAHDAVLGRDIIEARGGRVLRVPPREGRSSTNIIEKVLRLS
jgi:rfaE bifunctional protein nucleotidyltransferase chain/domain